MTEQWTRWEPISGLTLKYNIDIVSENAEKFEMILSGYTDATNKVRVLFENSVCAYRSADETYRYKLIVDLTEAYGKDFYGDWTFFTVNNSSYLRWLSEESYGTSDERQLKHFSFIGADLIVDIADPSEPRVEFI